MVVNKIYEFEQEEIIFVVLEEVREGGLRIYFQYMFIFI